MLNEYKTCIGTNKELMPILEQVNLMTPENIHLNSFMYEPLIDISLKSLKVLYTSLKTVMNKYEQDDKLDVLISAI
jgi:hypothetical protein